MKLYRGLSIAILLAVATSAFSLQAAEQTPPYTITVKLLADQKDPTLRRIWEKRYRDRLAAASDIIERCCHIRFKVVEVATWTSDDHFTDLGQLLDEFMHKVQPAPAQLVIGFTGQFRSLRDDKHIGGAKGPFFPYILIREWAGKSPIPNASKSSFTNWGTTSGQPIRPNPSRSCVPISPTGNREPVPSRSVSTPSVRKS